MAHQDIPASEAMLVTYTTWLRWLDAAENKSPETIRAYGQGLRRVLHYAGIEPSKFRPEELDQVQLTNVVWRMLAGDDEVVSVSRSTVTQALAAVNSFFDYCQAVDALKDPTFTVPDIRRIRKIARLDIAQPDPDYYRPAQLKDLFTAAAAPVNKEGVRWPVRDLAMCSYLAVLGLRAKELCDANYDWLFQERLVEVDDAANWILHVRGKGGKVRRLPISAELRKVSDLWQAVRQQRFGRPRGDDPLFVTYEGKRFNYQRLRYWLRRLNREAVVGEHSLHALRHTAGVQLASDGAPMNVIQSLLGHSSVATTGIYTELAGGQLMRWINEAESNRLLHEALRESS